jgi:dsDNA-binding SOS-regulon protein
MIETPGLSLVALERHLERAISDYLSVSRAGTVFAHSAARDQAEAEAWDRMMEAHADLDRWRSASDEVDS